MNTSETPRAEVCFRLPPSAFSLDAVSRSPLWEPPLDISPFGTHVLGMAGKVIEEGDVVRFRGSSGDEGRESLYRVIEVVGNDAIVEFLCDLTFPPLVAAKISELEPAEEDE